MPHWVVAREPPGHRYRVGVVRGVGRRAKHADLGHQVGTLHVVLIDLAKRMQPGDTLRTPEGYSWFLKKGGTS